MDAKASPPNDRDFLALESLLRWYAAMGVDAAVCESPTDRFTEIDGPSQARDRARRASSPGGSEGVAERPRSPVPPSADDLIGHAVELAAGAMTLDELRVRWQTVPGCALAATAARMIFSGGTPGAKVMLVGGAPDTDDERHGEAFSGPNGRLLDAMLHAVSLDRGHVYLANVIPWRPPGNRPPTPLELALCLPFARRHIALAAPTVLICLGERAAQPLLGLRDTISKLRGRWLSFEGETTVVRTMATFALDYLLKQPLQKRRVWADLLMLERELEREDP